IISLLGIIIYTLLYAIVGIFVNDQQEMQFAQLPVTVILVVAFVIAYMTIPNPGSVLSKICIYIPFTAPFLMGNAILNNTVSMFTIVISGISIIGFIFLCNYLIIRIFIPKKMIK
ncbi:ABC transporter permease, partial [uncultured Clostridium sp.]|uniref:ABC transporter permease n=1 Tax=uncultured Clostridium sp. TaxID=59620 RepID=UPI0025F67643